MEMAPSDILNMLLNINGRNKVGGKMIEEIKWCEENKITHIPYNCHQEEKAVLKREGEVSYLEFPALSEISFLIHGFSTREGGVSEGYLGTMNLNYSRGDNPENVDENFRRICKALGIDTENLVLSDQVHDTIVKRVGKRECQGKNLRAKKLTGVDGLITNEPKVALCTSYADCVPLFFADKVHKAVGHSHSGWRGTAGKIGAVTIKRMREEFGTKPTDLVVVIGPSICQSCYEVSQDVADVFSDFIDVEAVAKIQNIEKEIIEEQIQAVCVPTGNKKYHLDLWLANKLILMEAGVPEQNISISCICTCCNNKLLYSHRASCGKRGNLAGFLAIN